MLAVVRMRPPAEAALAATREGEVYLFYRVRGGRRRKEEEGGRGRRRRDRGINEGGRGVLILRG
jgi:hypothetical protein